jgi:hypothetical protein
MATRDNSAAAAGPMSDGSQSAPTAGAHGNDAPDAAPMGDVSHDAKVAVLGQFLASSFVAAGDAQGLKTMLDPQSDQHAFLAQPHA